MASTLVCCKCGHKTVKFECPKCRHDLCTSCKPPERDGEAVRRQKAAAAKRAENISGEGYAKARRLNVDLKLRIKLALAAIPRGADEDDSGEALHNYSRVSECTIQRVEEALNLRKPLTKYQRSRR